MIKDQDFIQVIVDRILECANAYTNQELIEMFLLCHCAKGDQAEFLGLVSVLTDRFSGLTVDELL